MSRFQTTQSAWKAWLAAALVGMGLAGCGGGDDGLPGTWTRASVLTNQPGGSVVSRSAVARNLSCSDNTGVWHAVRHRRGRRGRPPNCYNFGLTRL